jgi:thymidylate synthase
MQQYLDLMRDVMANGTDSGDRTGTGSRSVFGRMLRFDLSKGFPLVTTKKVNYRAVVGELLWFLTGSTNIQYLKDNDIKIWDNWANEHGEVGRMYGHNWMSLPDRMVGFSYKEVDNKVSVEVASTTINQLATLVDNIKSKPNSRRHVVVAWNPVDLPDESISPVENVDMNKPALTPCHHEFQVYVRDGKLSLKFSMRSVDVPIGLPYNIASYATLAHMLAIKCGYEVGDLICMLGDTHIYLNQFEAVEEQLKREPRPLPTLTINPDIDHDYNIVGKTTKLNSNYIIDDFTLSGYTPHPFIKIEISV